MKKYLFIVLLFACLFIVTSCNDNNIVPKEYKNSDSWTLSNLNKETLNASVLTYTKYSYENDVISKFEKSKFFDKVNSDSYMRVYELLNVYEKAIYNYEPANEQQKTDLDNLKSNYLLDKTQILNDDYIYIDYAENKNFDPDKDESIYLYFMIYYFDISANTLHYCSLQY